MRKKLSTSLSLLILSVQSACVTSHPVAPCPKLPVYPSQLMVPVPAPETFSLCLQSLVAQTSAQGLPSSCAQLQSWLSSIQNGKQQ